MLLDILVRWIHYLEENLLKELKNKRDDLYTEINSSTVDL